ncbi:MAG: hypothetical protein GYA36_19035 [Veillonellaceae bacterium]|nr:hypothetical protein [Veillonellaceae bacterium]
MTTDKYTPYKYAEDILLTYMEDNGLPEFPSGLDRSALDLCLGFIDSLGEEGLEKFRDYLRREDDKEFG